jgi:peptidoglycan/xylan/chitin deacetylase (PgdA/CDA1 family)
MSNDLIMSQKAENFTNELFLKRLTNDTSYLNVRKKIVTEYSHAKPGRWGEFVNGVNEDLSTKQKIIAFTFDACGGKNGNGYDKELIDYLHKEKIAATLFVTGRWIDGNFNTFLNLSKDTLFEIENHGLNHKPCSINGESEYGIHGTENVLEAFDEIEGNARKIEALTNHKPRYFRSATAFIDEACVRMAGELGITTVSYHVLSGDAVAFTPDSVIVQNVLRNCKPGAIVIMHFNHPKWNTFEAVQKIIPKLRLQGYQFVKLNSFPLTNRENKIIHKKHI